MPRHLKAIAVVTNVRTMLIPQNPETTRFLLSTQREVARKVSLQANFGDSALY
jgi:hypothetical protein